MHTELANQINFHFVYSQERLEVIERDQREYTLDDDDQKVQSLILNPEPYKNDAMVLKKTLSCSYPNLCFNEAIQKENEKLQLELQRSQANLDVGQCEVIQRLIDVTETVAADRLPEKNSPIKASNKAESTYTNSDDEKEHGFHETSPKKSSMQKKSRLVSLMLSLPLMWFFPWKVGHLFQ